MLLLSSGLARRQFSIVIGTLQNRILSDRYRSLLEIATQEGVIVKHGLYSVLRVLLNTSCAKAGIFLWTWGLKANILGWVFAALVPCGKGKVLSSIRSASAKRMFKNRFLYRIGGSFSTCIIANSNRALSLLRTYSGNTSRAFVLPNIVEQEWIAEENRFKPRNLPVPLRIAMLGNVRFKIKGYDIVLAAAKILRSKGVPVEFHIAGGGPEDEELRRQIASNDLNDVVFFHGKTEKPREFLLRHDCFLIASRFEGSSNSLLEALALGLPCFSSDVGDVEMINSSGDIVSVFGSENALALAEVLEAALKDWQGALKRGVMGREYIKRNHCEDKVLEVLIGILREVSAKQPLNRQE